MVDFIQKIPPQIIKVPDGWREVNPEVVDQIARSLPDRGLLQAIGVRPDPDEPGGFLLVFGRHRLEAHAKLGLEDDRLPHPRCRRRGCRGRHRDREPVPRPPQGP